MGCDTAVWRINVESLVQLAHNAIPLQAFPGSHVSMPKHQDTRTGPDSWLFLYNRVVGGS